MDGAALLRCICDGTRLEILGLLRRGGEMCVGDIAESLGRGQPLVSHHLATLRRCGIVASRSEGRKSMYSIPAGEVSSLIGGIERAAARLPGCCPRAQGCV